MFTGGKRGRYMATAPRDSFDRYANRDDRMRKDANNRIYYGEVPNYDEHIDVGQMYSDDIMSTSKEFLKAKSVVPYSRVHHRIDLSLINSDIGHNNNGDYVYELCGMNRKEDDDFHATVELISGSLKIPLKAFPDNANFSELNVTLCESTHSYVGQYAPYQFKMYPNFTKSNLAVNQFEQYILYEPEHPLIPYVRWADFSRISLNICDLSHKLIFKTPCKYADIVAGGGITTFTLIGHGLVTGDRINLKCTNYPGSYVVTYIDDDNFIIDTEILGVTNVEFIIENLNFSYNIIIYTLKQNESRVNL